MDQLYAGFRGLNEIDRSLMLMSLDGCTYQEMSEVMGITETNVGVRLILWWYLLPCVLGWGVIVYEKMLKDGLSTFELVYVVVACVFFAWVYWANRRIAVNRYGPRREQLEEMLYTIDSTDKKS